MIDKQKNDDQYFVIFASDFDNTATAYEMRLRHIGFKELKGRYKGIDEDSYIININDLEKVKDLIKDQESILVLGARKFNGTRRAMLAYNDGRTADIGSLTPVDKEEAEASEGYTKDGQQYYICK